MNNDFSALIKTVIVSIWDVGLIALAKTWPAASQQLMFVSAPEAEISSNNKEKLSKNWRYLAATPPLFAAEFPKLCW